MTRPATPAASRLSLRSSASAGTVQPFMLLVFELILATSPAAAGSRCHCGSPAQRQVEKTDDHDRVSDSREPPMTPVVSLRARELVAGLPESGRWLYRFGEDRYR